MTTLLHYQPCHIVFQADVSEYVAKLSMTKKELQETVATLPQQSKGKK